ncbi:MAG TPA: mannosyl-3-phosphoglycerate synthase [Nitrososphaeraceae archaeon]|jgi:mannosyl-3-phosphoglycerate synthase|nr:mannosyl-3-phosphoglycerate synthase [Thermoproteota archaeon]MDQ3971154.1 mannosyl-3-phosphoglycerate synthase [Thermoproteota archaeon]HZA64571.1 mannosyl-3-phosphoglycerate synthase [Nitrososphaeraceae archaeon]
MRVDLPRYTERFGSISLHGVQRVYELDSGSSNGRPTSEAIRRIGNEEMSEIERKMAIVIPVKGERLKLLEGVLSGIPHDCLTIIVSNSPRQPVDRYKLEKEALEQFNQFAEKNALIVHQKDPGLSEALREVGYTSIFGPDDMVRNGKAEGMMIGMLLTKMAGKEYVGFIDADNYVPGAVNEYVKIYASGIAMSNTPYTMVRVSWIYKPKISETGVYFSKWGRVSEITNQYLNSLISYYTGFETEVMRTGNSGEHCMSMKLAELLTYSSSFSVETYEMVNLLEEFGGIVPTENQEAMDKGIEVMQVETRNPHFHEEKGDIHLKEMIDGSLGCIYHSKICHPKLREKIVEELRGKGLIEENQEPSVLQKINPFKDIDMLQFGKILHNKATSFVHS